MPDQPAPASHLTQTPVLFLIHRRLEVTARVFEAIRQARPRTLLIAADGPEADERCQQCRQFVLSHIDWPCEVETRFLPERQGSRRAVSGALKWAFSNHERVIVLEDDCLPTLTFFKFCDELLDRYAHVPEVMHISGSNLTGYSSADGASYFFSRFGSIWGWASWRRAWDSFDVDMKAWPEVRRTRKLKKLCPLPFEAMWHAEHFDDTIHFCNDAWDYQWDYARMMQAGINVVPSVNLISNIGFGPEATHTLVSDHWLASLPRSDVSFPLIHPATIKTDTAADRLYVKKIGELPTSYFSLRALRWFLGWGKRQVKRWLHQRKASQKSNGPVLP